MRGSPKTQWGGVGNAAASQAEMDSEVAEELATLFLTPKHVEKLEWTEPTCALSTGQRTWDREK